MWQCKIVSKENHKILNTKNKRVDDILFPGCHNELCICNISRVIQICDQ